MSFHKVILSMISILATFIQVKFQSGPSLFQTQFWIMSTFFVFFSIYVSSLITVKLQDRGQHTRNNNHGMIVVLSKASLLVGAFSAILLLFIIQPVHGWVALLLWILYSLKTVYELVNIGTFIDSLKS